MRRSALLLAALIGLSSLAGVAGSTTAVARLRVAPTLVQRGATLTVRGSGFVPKVKVTIDVGRPNSAPTAHWTTLKANATGGFRYAKVISRSAFAGQYVVRACQRTCRVKATASYRIVKVKPV
jgi:hypothetical protein